MRSGVLSLSFRLICPSALIKPRNNNLFIIILIIILSSYVAPPTGTNSEARQAVGRVLWTEGRRARGQAAPVADRGGADTPVRPVSSTSMVITGRALRLPESPPPEASTQRRASSPDPPERLRSRPAAVFCARGAVLPARTLCYPRRFRRGGTPRPSFRSSRACAALVRLRHRTGTSRVWTRAAIVPPDDRAPELVSGR